MRTYLFAILLVVLTGCGTQATSTYQVKMDQDNFTETVDGKTVSFANWKLSAGNRTIDIPHVDSTIIVRRSGGRVTVDVNGKTVYQD
jgi:hypothetical protein